MGKLYQYLTTLKKMEMIDVHIYRQVVFLDVQNLRTIELIQIESEQ